jgi:DUF2075 family protein
MDELKNAEVELIIYDFENFNHNLAIKKIVSLKNASSYSSLSFKEKIILNSYYIILNRRIRVFD